MGVHVKVCRGIFQYLQSREGYGSSHMEHIEHLVKGRPWPPAALLTSSWAEPRCPTKVVTVDPSNSL